MHYSSQIYKDYISKETCKKSSPANGYNVYINWFMFIEWDQKVYINQDFKYFHICVQIWKEKKDNLPILTH